MHTRFDPDPARVEFFDDRMRAELARSLRYLRGQLGDRVALDEAAFEASLARIEANRVRPDTFAVYYAAVMTAADGRHDDAEDYLREISEATPAPEGIDFFAFCEPESHVRSNRFLAILNSDPDTDFPIRPVTDAQKVAAEDLIHQALELLEAGDAQLGAEIRRLLNVILLGTGPNEEGEYTFDGASAFELWGSIALNVLRAGNRVEMAEILAHESCHMLLFGYCIDGHLVLNPDADRYASPLREDLRPIDGIFHATFVLARMYHALRVMHRSGLLSEAELVEVERRQQLRASAFHDGLSVLKAHAQYTEAGAALMRAAEAYMEEHVRGLKVG